MEMEELYQEILLDHFKHPRNAAVLDPSEVLADEENPLCGDHIRLAARVADGILQDIRHETRGCAISVASASMMSERLRGLSTEEAGRRIADFLAFMRGEKELSESELGDLAALGGVRKFPLRIKCVTLGWHAMEKALAKLAPPPR